MHLVLASLLRAHSHLPEGEADRKLMGAPTQVQTGPEIREREVRPGARGFRTRLQQEWLMINDVPLGRNSRQTNRRYVDAVDQEPDHPLAVDRILPNQIRKPIAVEISSTHGMPWG